MHSEVPELRNIYIDLKAGRTATPTTIRYFLSWFGVQRRTYHNVAYIEKELKKCDIQTVPNYLNIWVDTPITFELISEKGKRDGDNTEEETRSAQAENPSQGASVDPSFRVGKIKAATRGIIHVKPNEPISKAMTIMMARNFSQLPVMTTDREVKGVVSWTSIGERFATGKTGSESQHFMDDHHEINSSASLFVAIRIISEDSYVVVKDISKRYTGIITANDIADEFEETSMPFVLLSEIENHLRALIDGRLSIEDIKSTCEEQYLPRDFQKISDLTFGNHVYIFDNNENWTKIGLALDKGSFVNELREANKIRNEVMHFDSDSIKPEDLVKLKDLSRLLNTLKRISLIPQ